MNQTPISQETLDHLTASDAVRLGDQALLIERGQDVPLGLDRLADSHGAPERSPTLAPDEAAQARELLTSTHKIARLTAMPIARRFTSRSSPATCPKSSCCLTTMLT